MALQRHSGPFCLTRRTGFSQFSWGFKRGGLCFDQRWKVGQELPEGDLEHDLGDAKSTGPCAVDGSVKTKAAALSLCPTANPQWNEKEMPAWSNTNLDNVHVHLKRNVKKICAEQEPMIVHSNNVV